MKLCLAARLGFSRSPDDRIGRRVTGQLASGTVDGGAGHDRKQRVPDTEHPR